MNIRKPEAVKEKKKVEHYHLFLGLAFFSFLFLFFFFLVLYFFFFFCFVCLLSNQAKIIPKKPNVLRHKHFFFFGFVLAGNQLHCVCVCVYAAVRYMYSV